MDCSKCESEIEEVFEISAGELTVSGQRRFTTEIKITDKIMTIKNYMNTKKFSTPEEYQITADDIVSINKTTRFVLRKLHKIRLGGAVFLFSLTFVAGIYCVLAALLLAGLTMFDARERALEVVLKKGQKIYVYYIDEDDINIVEKAIRDWCK